MLAASLLAVAGLVSGVMGGLPSKSLGFYCLVADDTVSGYTSTDNWQPSLYDYQLSGANVIWLTFINPDDMPSIPPAMANLAKCRGQGGGCPNQNQTIILSVGGEAYSNHQWSWLASQSAAESMAASVAEWSSTYGVDGIDLDIEGSAGGNTAATNIVHFARKLKQLNPNFIVTQPVYGYPQIAAENAMVNNGWDANGNPTGIVDSIGIMVYSDLNSLQWVKDYADATDEWDGFPITVDVPTKSILAGIQGTASSSTIGQMASSVNDQSLGGFMVWYASVWDKTRNSVAFQYGGGDASTAKDSAWTAALHSMTSTKVESKKIN